MTQQTKMQFITRIPVDFASGQQKGIDTFRTFFNDLLDSYPNITSLSAGDWMVKDAGTGAVRAPNSADMGVIVTGLSGLSGTARLPATAIRDLPASGIAGVIIQDEGTQRGTDITTINITGAGATATVAHRSRHSNGQQ